MSSRHLADYGYHVPSKRPTEATAAPPGLSDPIWRWLDDLTMLRPVPFHYLVPDERLLPAESLRFFSVDRQWLRCLRDGAFSVGRVLRADAARDAATIEPELRAKQKMPVLSGFLLRSKVVAGWPDLDITAYTKIPASRADREKTVLPPKDYPRPRLLRSTRLADDVLLHLYEGEVKMVDMHPRPELLQFGFDIPNDAGSDRPDLLRKDKRGPLGNQTGRMIGPIPWRDEPRRVVRMDEWVAMLGDDLSPAAAALQMVAGVELVRFCRRKRI